MPTCVCAVSCCSNNTRKLRLWKKLTCQKHECNYGTGRCVCSPPFTLYPFPTEMKDPEGRHVWTQLVCQNIPSRKHWAPSRYERVCSKHFKDGMPTAQNPYPVLHLNDPGAKANRRGRPRHPGILESIEVPEKIRKLEKNATTSRGEPEDEDELFDDSEPGESDENSRDSQDVTVGDVESLVSRDSQESDDTDKESLHENETAAIDEDTGNTQEEEPSEPADLSTAQHKDDATSVNTPTSTESCKDLTSSNSAQVQEQPMDLQSSKNSSDTINSAESKDGEVKSQPSHENTIKEEDKTDANPSTTDAPIDLRSSSPKTQKAVNVQRMPPPTSTVASESAQPQVTPKLVGTVAKEKTLTASDMPINLKSSIRPGGDKSVHKQILHLQALQPKPSQAPQHSQGTPVRSSVHLAGGSIPRNQNFTMVPSLAAVSDPGQSKYNDLLTVIEDMGREVRPTYAGSKTSMERLKRGITYARVLLQQCKVEAKRSARY
ncbi:uncharacterized protein LOC144449632 [Glandiceps talaboti]